MSVQESLREIGLNEKEAKVYLSLLKNGRVTPAALAKLTKVSRPTVYNIVKSLLSKGIIAEDVGGKTMHLVPLPPQNLKQIVDKPKRELEEKERAIDKLINDLSLVTANKRYQVPKIRFVEEDELEDFLYQNTKKWNEALLDTDATWWGFQDHGFVEEYEKWIFWFWKQKEYQIEKVRTKLLSNDSSVEKRMEKILPRKKRDIRFLSGINFTATVWVTGDYLTMITTKQHPFSLVEIHDATLAHNMREVFKKLWSLTEEIKDNSAEKDSQRDTK